DPRGPARGPAPEGAERVRTPSARRARSVADGRPGPRAPPGVGSGGGGPHPGPRGRRGEPPPPRRTATECGLDADAKEAYLFALLGYLPVHGLPGTAPADPADPDGPRATGARLPAVLGSLTPPVPVPRTAALAPVRRLVVAPAGGQ